MGYNVQTAVDAKHHMIVAYEVTNAVTDRGQLASMAKLAKAATGQEMVQARLDGAPEASRLRQRPVEHVWL